MSGQLKSRNAICVSVAQSDDHDKSHIQEREVVIETRSKLVEDNKFQEPRYNIDDQILCNSLFEPTFNMLI